MPEDAAEAVRWYRLAADQGFAAAQYNLGTMYVRGRGVPEDVVTAHMWVSLAASRSTSDVALDRAAQTLDLIAEELTASQRAEAQRLAREWAAAHPRDEPPSPLHRLPLLSRLAFSSLVVLVQFYEWSRRDIQGCSLRAIG